jgi:hypothetical protein
MSWQAKSQGLFSVEKMRTIILEREGTTFPIKPLSIVARGIIQENMNYCVGN